MQENGVQMTVCKDMMQYCRMAVCKYMADAIVSVIVKVHVEIFWLIAIRRTSVRSLCCEVVSHWTIWRLGGSSHCRLSGCTADVVILFRRRGFLPGHAPATIYFYNQVQEGESSYEC